MRRAEPGHMPMAKRAVQFDAASFNRRGQDQILDVPAILVGERFNRFG
jgi:hypothetical protein